VEGLTLRQREVLRLLAQGCRQAEIAAALAISPVTVKAHIDSARERLGCDNNVQLVAKATRGGLL
jgi:DNA-binding CsgD family transcriptional regulator